MRLSALDGGCVDDRQHVLQPADRPQEKDAFFKSKSSSRVLRPFVRPREDLRQPPAVRGNVPGAHSLRQHQPNSPGGFHQIVVGSARNHDASVSGYIRWPHAANRRASAEERAAYFLQLHSSTLATPPDSEGKQATTLLELMTIRAYHSKTLRRHSLGTALGLRTRNGQLTQLPAIIVFVSRKVHDEWLMDLQKLPQVLHGPGGFWCDVDVVEFSYYGSGNAAPREQIYNALVEGLRGNDADLGPGSQVASEEMYGTLGAVVRSRRDHRPPGFLTNRHVAVDFDQPKQKMYHPLPPSLGPGMYLGSVERATSFTTDHSWYGVFAGQNPETFVRADGAFIPFWDNFDLRKVTTRLKGIGNTGRAYLIDLNDPISSLVGRPVSKLGGSSGLTRGIIMAYSVEYNDDKGACFITDFLILGEAGQPFDTEGDSGSMVVLQPENGELPQPVGIIWGGTANRGRLKLRNGHGPENWTSGVDISRLLALLELDLIVSPEELQAASANRPERRVGESSESQEDMVGPGGGDSSQESLGAARFAGAQPSSSLLAQRRPREAAEEGSGGGGSLGGEGAAKRHRSGGGP